MIIWMATVLLSLFFNLTFPASAQEKGRQKTVIDPTVVKSIEKLGGSVRRIAQNEDAIEDAIGKLKRAEKSKVGINEAKKNIATSY